jgi:hypothetical protein
MSTPSQTMPGGATVGRRRRASAAGVSKRATSTKPCAYGPRLTSGPRAGLCPLKPRTSKAARAAKKSVGVVAKRAEEAVGKKIDALAQKLPVFLPLLFRGLRLVGTVAGIGAVYLGVAKAIGLLESKADRQEAARLTNSAMQAVRRDWPTSGPPLTAQLDAQLFQQHLDFYVRQIRDRRTERAAAKQFG